MKYGDKVRVIEEGSHGRNIGETGVIENCDGSDKTYCVKMDKSNETRWFNEDEIELYKPTKKELLELPIGTKITTDLEEYNVFVKTDEDTFEDLNGSVICDYDIKDNLSINDEDYGTKIIKIEVPTYETIYNGSKEVKEMTIAEISKALGYEVKIVKEDK